MAIDLTKHMDDPHYSERGRRMEPILIWRDCYHLLAVFGGSARLRQAGRFAALADDWEETEANRLLLSVAILARDSMDTAWVEHETPVLPSGKLIANVKASSPREVGLNSRDACNKIIHATVVKFDRTSRGGLSGAVRLRGELGKASWLCGFDVVDFVDALRDPLNI